MRSGNICHFRIRSCAVVFIAVFFLLYTFMEASAFTRILKQPGVPVFISLEQKKYERGRINRAWLRTDSFAERLTEIEGMELISNTDHLHKDLDGDKRKDSIWKVILGSEDNKLLYMWCVTLSGSGKGWLFTTPCGRTLWDENPFRIDVPENILLYISPSTPSYKDRQALEGMDVLTFVYTLMVTEKGPSLVLSPEVYKAVKQIAQMVKATEADPERNEIYEHILRDYTKMASGQMPSSDSVLNFRLKNLTNFQLQ